jgi:hypothetical protein
MIIFTEIILIISHAAISIFLLFNYGQSLRPIIAKLIALTIWQTSKNSQSQL